MQSSRLWLLYEQDGRVGLGQGAVGPVLKFRKRIVQTLGAKEHEDIDELKDLPEEACDSLYENPIKLIADFAETVGSLGSVLLIDPDTHYSVGLDISANHVAAAKEGLVIATAKLVHAGRKTHLWNIEVRDAETNRLISHGKHTVMVLPKEN